MGTVRIDGRDYWLVVGSSDDGMFLECTLESDGTKVLVEVFYNDENRSFTIQTSGAELPLALVKLVIAEAERRLPPVDPLGPPGAGSCMQTSRQVSPFGWNAGGWFGALLGSTIWLLVLGVSMFPEDLAAGALALAGFAVGNLWGIALWRRRDRLSAYSGLQWMMVGLLIVFAAVVLIANAKVPSILLPYWVIAVPLPLMAMFWLRQQAARGPNTA